MTTPKVTGLDLSSTSTGVCTSRGTTFTIEPDPKLGLQQRCRIIARDTTVAVSIDKPDLIVVEAIGTRFIQAAISAATVHALVLDAIGDTSPIWMVAPNQLKKWATGKGAGKGTDKVAMVLAAQRNGWEPTPDATDDEADAWWLWTIGRAHLGHPVVPETAYRTELLAKFRKEALCANS